MRKMLDKKRPRVVQDMYLTQKEKWLVVMTRGLAEVKPPRCLKQLSNDVPDQVAQKMTLLRSYEPNTSFTGAEELSLLNGQEGICEKMTQNLIEKKFEVKKSSKKHVKPRKWRKVTPVMYIVVFKHFKARLYQLTTRCLFLIKNSAIGNENFNKSFIQTYRPKFI